MRSPTITASRDFDYFNRMMNHADIKPSISDDSSAIISDIASLNQRANVFLKVQCDGADAGFAIFVAKGVFCYEMHSGVTEGFRGSFALEAGIAILDWMFTNTDAEMISTFAWTCAKNTMWAARQIGFREISRSPWKHTVKGDSVDRVMYSLHLMDWARDSKERFDGMGFSLVKDFEGTSEIQPFAGISMLISLSGNYSKAQDFYNKWAVILGCPPIRFNGTRADGVIFSVSKSVVEISRELKTSIVEQVA